MIYLELDDVLAIACEVLGLEVDALVHVTDLGLAGSAVARPRAGFAGEEFHPTVEAKAASLLFGLARNHAFIDGNKRVAVLATLQFLNTNGYPCCLRCSHLRRARQRQPCQISGARRGP